MEEEKTVLIESETEDGTNNSFTSKTPIWKSKLFLIITGICIVAVTAIITTIVIVAGNENSDIEQRLETANRYLLELDYEQAKAEFEKIIKADPKCVDAYIGLSEAYEGLGEPEKAREILEEGYEKIKSDKIKNLLDEWEGTPQEMTTVQQITTAQETTTEPYIEGVHWKIEGNTLIIYGNGVMDDYDSLYSEDGMLMGSTAPWCEDNYREVKSVIIEDGVTNIGNNAFIGSDGLASIEIPNSLTNIGEDAFAGCSSLTNIKIPNSVTDIGENAFVRCSSLTNIIIPNGVTNIGKCLFFGCSSLTSIEIPNSVISIGWGTFEYCSNLTSVEIPNSVAYIDCYAFSYCSNLKRIVIPNSVEKIEKSAFWECDNLTIYGKAGSYAETYANEEGIPFIAQ